MHLFSRLLLLERDGSEDRGGNHSGSVNESQRLVPAYGAASLVARYFGSKDCVRGSGEIHARSHPAERGMKVEIGLTWLCDCLALSALCLGHGTGDEGRSHGNQGVRA